METKNLMEEVQDLPPTLLQAFEDLRQHPTLKMVEEAIEIINKGEG